MSLHDSLQHLHDWIQRQFQKFTDWSQITLGLSKFFWEKATCLVFAALGCTAFMFLSVKEGFIISLLCYMEVTAHLLLGVIYVPLLDFYEKQFFEKGLLNKTRDFWSNDITLEFVLIPLLVFILLMLACLFVDVGQLFFSGWLFCYFVIHFIANCVPKPPSQSKLNKFVSSLLWKIVGDTAPKPA
ncbi:hypothetical protein KC851_02405 [Candidatus Kaiserbacteria bacterium]|nr:hypothetical protein [Candidatus Kaiserbacteria bacterium]